MVRDHGIEEQLEIGQGIWYRRTGGDWLETMVKKNSWRLVRDYGKEEQEEIGHRPWYRRTAGDCLETMV